MRALLARAVRDITAYAQLHPLYGLIYFPASRTIPSACRNVWSDAVKADSALQDRFYDSTVEKVLSRSVRVQTECDSDGHFVRRETLPVAVCPPGGGSPVPAADARVWACCTL